MILKSIEQVLFVFSLILKGLELSLLFLFDPEMPGIVLFDFSSILNIWYYISLFVFDLEKFRTSSLRFYFDPEKSGAIKIVFSSILKGLELSPLFLFDPKKLLNSSIRFFLDSKNLELYMFVSLRSTKV